MKRSQTLLALCIMGSFVLPVSAVSRNETTDNFKKTYTYTQGQFLDVPGTAWFAPYVKEAYEYGAMTGISETYFNPTGNLSIAEAITVACWLNTTYYYGDDAINHYDFSENSVWYLPFVNYAQENGIIGTQYDQLYEKEATRADFATIIEASLPYEALQTINIIEGGSIPDVPVGSAYYDAVYHLYRAGIISGVDANGSFLPAKNITRAEMAVILRNIISLSKSLPNNPISTIADLEEYLNKNLSSCETPLGTYFYQFNVRERTYDFIIETVHTNGSPWYELKYSDAISDKIKQETLSVLREFQENIYQIAADAFPNQAIAGGFCDRGYKYPNIQVNPYVITALSWANHDYTGDNKTFSFYWDTSRDTYDFNSGEENADVETEITSISGLENYLNKNLSTCETPMGTYSLKFDVSENTYNFNGWDIEILTEGNYSVLPWAEINNSIKYTEEEREETLNILKNIQKEIYEIASEAFPNKKLTGCYFSDWYKYPSLEVGYETNRHLTWTNYTSDSYAHDYNSTYITSFHWDDWRDD